MRAARPSSGSCGVLDLQWRRWRRDRSQADCGTSFLATLPRLPPSRPRTQGRPLVAAPLTPIISPLPRPPSLAQQNEILRENQFNNWGMHSGNLFGLLMMVVVLPLGYRKLYMQELAGKEIAEGVPVRDRF
jgi:hypothetical protein